VHGSRRTSNTRPNKANGAHTHTSPTSTFRNRRRVAVGKGCQTRARTHNSTTIKNSQFTRRIYQYRRHHQTEHRRDLAATGVGVVGCAQVKRYLPRNVGPPSIVPSSAMATNDRPSKKGACNAVSPSRSKVRRCFALAPKPRARSPVSEADSWIGRAHFRRRWQSRLQYLRLHLPRSAPAQSFLTAFDALGDGQDRRVQTQHGRGVRVG
jgi:hypothetical protein